MTSSIASTACDIMRLTISSSVDRKRPKTNSITRRSPDGGPSGSGPIPARNRGNSPLPSSAMIDFEAVMTAGGTALADPQRSQRKIEIIGYDKELRWFGPEHPHRLHHRHSGTVDESQRLDQMEFLVADRRRDIFKPHRSAGSGRNHLRAETVDDIETKVMPGMLILGRVVAQPADYLHHGVTPTLSNRHAAPQFTRRIGIVKVNFDSRLGGAGGQIPQGS